MAANKHPAGIDQAPPGTHMCFLFDDPAQQLDVISRFLAGGLMAGGHADYFTDMTEPAALLDALVRSGVPRKHLDDEHLAVRSAGSVYCRDGHFSRDRMLDQLTAGFDSHAGRFPGPIQIGGEMSWALRPGVTGLDELVPYEAAINDVIRERPFTAVCQYDARRFDGALLYEIMKAHPYVVVRGQVIANCLYDPGFRGSARGCPGET